MKQVHLEDQSRSQFNQGIRRSLQNGFFLSLISTTVIASMGILNSVSVYGLSDGLSGALSYELSTWVAGIVVMLALSGGLTILRHYEIRWLLARHRMFPWRAQAFLDDATTRILLQRVGGGYSFIHRRLQDYFADAMVPPLQK